MPEFHPQQLQEWSHGRWEGPPPRPVASFAFDSRRLRPGDLFVCLKTAQRDGHDFIADAAAAGASGALVSRYHPEVELPQLVVKSPLQALQSMGAAHRKSFARPVVGISGSCGKTSTKDLLKLLLGGASTVHATEGNLNNLIGVPITLLALDPETHLAAVIEAGINLPGEMAGLADIIQPTAAIITMVAAVHLEKLESLEGVAREKAILPQAVPAEGVVVFPSSCLCYAPFQRMTAHVIAPGEGTEGSPHFRVEQRPETTVVHIGPEGEEKSFPLRKVSHGMAANAVLAIEMARALGVTDEEVTERLRAWRPAKFRGEVVVQGETRFFVDCYNANPTAMADALEFFHEVADSNQPRLYVLGCMGELGEQSEAMHRKVGQGLRLRRGDRAFLIGRDAEALRAGLLDAGNEPGQVVVFNEVAEIAGAVANHRGFVFLKGSRVYGLEVLVERVRELKEVGC
jgi:UDP-N-acetylmuramoyl-tripeptide--D-alanyl-D-alanine ligase